MFKIKVDINQFKYHALLGAFSIWLRTRFCECEHLYVVIFYPLPRSCHDSHTLRPFHHAPTPIKILLHSANAANTNIRESRLEHSNMPTASPTRSSSSRPQPDAGSCAKLVHIYKPTPVNPLSHASARLVSASLRAAISSWTLPGSTSDAGVSGMLAVYINAGVGCRCRPCRGLGRVGLVLGLQEITAGLVLI